MKLPILLQDSEMVVVNKPAGLLVHRTSLSDANYFAVQILRDQLGLRVFPVHRLDRPTSGALVFALNPHSARVLASQFGSRQVEKTYLAVVRGFPAAEAFTVNHALKEELDAIADRQARKDKPAQEAVTHFETLDKVEIPVRVDKYPSTRYALVRAYPHTGRKHQIRRHLRHAGHPIAGDVTHGSGAHNRFFKDHLNSRRLLLACTQLRFRHPVSGARIEIKAPLEMDFRETLERLGWSRHAES